MSLTPCGAIKSPGDKSGVYNYLQTGADNRGWRSGPGERSRAAGAAFYLVGGLPLILISPASHLCTRFSRTSWRGLPVLAASTFAWRWISDETRALNVLNLSLIRFASCSIDK